MVYTMQIASHATLGEPIAVSPGAAIGRCTDAGDCLVAGVPAVVKRREIEPR